jgi:hypothetical protein
MSMIIHPGHSHHSSRCQWSLHWLATFITVLTDSVATELTTTPLGEISNSSHICESLARPLTEELIKGLSKLTTRTVYVYNGSVYSSTPSSTIFSFPITRHPTTPLSPLIHQLTTQHDPRPNLQRHIPSSTRSMGC